MPVLQVYYEECTMKSNTEKCGGAYRCSCEFFFFFQDRILWGFILKAKPYTSAKNFLMSRVFLE